MIFFIHQTFRDWLIEKRINIPGGHAWRHFFMACSKLVAMAIYVVKQACRHDIRAWVCHGIKSGSSDQSETLSKFNAYWCVFSGYPVPCTGYLLWETIGLSKEVLTRSSQYVLGLSHQKKMFFKVKPIYENIDTFKQYEAVKFSENCIRQVGFFFCDAKSSIFRFFCPSSKSSF